MLQIFYSDGADILKLDAHMPDNKLDGKDCIHFSIENDTAKQIIEQENLTVFPVLIELNVVNDVNHVTKLAEGLDAILAYNA